MRIQLIRNVLLQRLLCLFIAVSTTAVMTSSGLGQGATQAVRGRASGLRSSPGGLKVDESPPTPEPPPAQPPTSPVTPPAVPPGVPAPPGPTAGKLDTTYVLPNASILLVLRPAQIMSSPVVQMLPTEVATAAGKQYLGIDPADVDEVVAFGSFPNPLARSYGVTVKFNKPFRAVNIPQPMRATAKLSEFNGKKYLQSSQPLFPPSYYGPNNKTLITAPDAVLRQIVQASSQPKSGGLLDRVRDVPAGSDLYVALDGTLLRTFAPLILASINKTLSPEEKAALDATAALEMTLNLATRGPVAFVVHCNDEAGAVQVEAVLAKLRQTTPEPTTSEQPPANNLLQQAMMQYQARINQRYPLQRNGTSITWMRIEADDPLQPQLIGIVIGALQAAGPQLEAQYKAFAQKGAAPATVPAGAAEGAAKVAVPPGGPAASLAPGEAVAPQATDAERR